MRRISILLFLSSILAIQLSAFQYQSVPALDARVTDKTNTLSSTQIKSIESVLAQFEKQKGSQIAVLLVPTTEPETIEQYAIKVVEQWKIGREGIDDGVLLLIAKNDRKMRLEVGYGLEGAIPDAYSKRIIEQVIKPEFRSGDFYHGITKGVDALMGLIDGEQLPESEHGINQADSGWSKYLNLLFPLLIIFVALGNYLLKKMLGKRWGTVAFMVVLFLVGTLIFNFLAGIFISIVMTLMWSFPGGKSGGRRGGGGGWYGGFGGGSSGGSFGGGFSGGGGSFGGGGASGGW